MCAISQAFDFFFEREPFMAILSAYFDESGKSHEHRVITFCGVCSSPSRIKAFEEQWDELLRRYGMPCLSMKWALRLKRPLSKTVKAHTVRERIEALKPFADCIRQNIELSLAIAVDVEAYANLSVEARKRLGGSEDPHYLAFMSGILGPVVYTHNDDHVSLICDDDEQTALNCYQFYRRIRKLHGLAHEKLVSISFAQDRKFLPLQAADLIASLARLEARLLFEGRPYDYRALFNYLTAPNAPSGMRWGLSFYDEKPMKEMGKRLEKNPLGTKQTWLHY